MDKNIVFLHPDDIGVHPTVEYLEEGGAFRYDKRHLDMMVDSIRNIDFLQPILVTPAPEGSEKKYLRVAGKLRVEAARVLGQTVPCYIREFDSEQMLIDAIISENSKRRFVDVMAIEKEKKLIDKLLSERAKKAAREKQSASPRIRNLFKEAKISCSDDTINYILSLPSEIQDTAARTIIKILKETSASNVKITKANDIPDVIKQQIEDRARDEIMEQVKEEIEKYRNNIASMEKNINNLTAERDSLLNQINKIFDDMESKVDSEEVVESLQKEINRLKKEIYEKESEIKKLNNRIYETERSLSDSLYEVCSKKNAFLDTAITSAMNNIKLLFEQIKSTIGMMYDPSVTAENVVVVTDKYEKLWDKISNLHGEVMAVLRDLYEKKAGNGKTQTHTSEETVNRK